MLKQNHVTYFILITAALIVLFLYNPWLLYFQNDDLIHIPLSRDGILLQHNTFRPVCDVSIMLDYKLWGKQAWGYHFTNLVLHAIDSILVFVFCRLCFKKYKVAHNSAIAAFTVAVLFWIYMNHSEAVFWILGRSALLGVLFFLPSVMFYLKRTSPVHLFFCIIFSLLAWLSYESTWILPAVLAAVSLADIQKSYSNWKVERKYIITVAIAFLIYLSLRFYFTGAITGLYEVSGVEHFGVLFLGENFIKLAIRGWLPPSDEKGVLISAALILATLIILSLIRTPTRQRRTVVMALTLWLISMLPYLTLGIDTKGVESERFLYLPSLFICIFIVLVICRFSFRFFIPSLVIICSVNILFLAYHARDYRLAGRVNEMTISELQKMKNKRAVFVIDVPQSQNGALLLRKGLPEAVQWLVDKKSVDTVIILSWLRPDVLKDNYRVSYSNDRLLYSKDVSAEIPDELTYPDNERAILKFTDSVLYVFK